MNAKLVRRDGKVGIPSSGPFGCGGTRARFIRGFLLNCSGSGLSDIG